MSPRNVDVLAALMPEPDTDLAGLVRDDSQFAAIAEGLGDLLHPDLVSVPAWRGGRTAYTGIEGFREMWLDWLEPWETYHVKVEEMIEVGDRVVVLIRDRGRRHDMDAEVELLAGSLWTFRDGRVARVVFYGNREEVRAAAGPAG